MKKLLSFFAAFLFAGSMMAADPVEITSGTFNGKQSTYTEGWSTNGTGKSRTDCVVIGAGENITSPSVDLSQYESISIAIKARRFGTLSGSKAQIAVTFGGENVGSTEASGTSATTSLSAIEYTVVAATAKTGNFVVTCSNATSAGSTHGAGINSIVITGVKKASQGGQGGGETPSTTKTVYCKVAQDWWKADGAAVGVYAFKGETHNAEWPGVRMTAVEGETDLWKADIDTAAYSAIIFTRMNPSNDGNQDWGAKTADLTIPADKDLYTITSTSAVWGDPGVTGTWSVYGEEPVVVEPTLANGFYLIGKINGVEGWAVANLSADRKFAGNPDNNAEFVLTATLAEGDEIKVVNVLNDEITAWYPAEGGNYTVDAAHAGEKDIYFRPDLQGGEGWFGACIYIAANAEPQPVAAVELPATLDVTNVSFRSEGMPDFVIEEGQDYAGTYFDMGAHDSSNDTLLYAEWNVTIQPMKYNVAVDVYNENSWSVQLYLLNQAGDTVKALRHKGSSGQKGQFAIGVLDLSDLEAGDYKVRVHAATAWSQMKLKDVIFVADYKGVSVELPGTLQPAYAELSTGASVANNAIAFAPGTANSEYATWNVSFAKAGIYNVTIDMTASNGHTYGVALLTADGAEQIGVVAEAQSWDTGVKALGSIAVPAAGNYKVKLTNATQWSEAVLNSVTFDAAPVYAISGAWHEFDKDLFEVATDGKTASFSIFLNHGDYEFKIRKDDAWLTRANNGVAYGLHRKWAGVAGVVDDASENLKLTADVAGTYKFVWTFANDSLGIVFPAELQAVSEATSWDFSKIVRNTENALHSSNGIKLTDTSTPNKNEEVVYANYSADFMTFSEGFDAATMAFKGEYPTRNNKFCQAGTVHFKTTVAGSITVKFSDTGSSASASAVKRYLVVNGEQTEYWTSRENNGEQPYAAKLDVVTDQISVPAGDVTITGTSAICIYNVTFAPAPAEPAKYFLKNNWDAAENWTWKEMTKDGDNYKLDSVVFGGLGVNYNTAESDDDAVWVELADIEGDEFNTKDTVSFVLNPADGTITATLVGAFVEPAVHYYLKNNWDAAETWTWKAMTKDGETYKLENVVFGGTGVNYNTAESDEGSVWVALEDMEGDEIDAKDTVTFVLNPADGTITATLVGAFFEPIDLQDCDWENIAFVGGPAEYAEQFKVCKPENVNVVNIQNPAWSTKTQMGIYMTFPAASFGNITLDEDLYEIQGAGILFFLSAFTAQETEFIVNCEGNNLAITVYNVKADGPELEHAYTVAGSSDAVFGTAWDPTNTDNDMVKQEDGTYKFVKANVVLPAGAIGFKVCEDYAWDVAYPASDYQLNIAEAGEYTITITFDPETKAVAATADKTAVVEVDPTVSAKGSWDEWTNEIPFVLSDDKTTATLTIANVAAGTYEFKVILNGGDWRSNAHVFTRTDAEAEGINGNDNTNMKLFADVEGEYVFTWTFATNSLSVEFPDGEVVEPTLENGYYLVGDFNDWTPAAEYLFAANEGADGEFVLNTSLEGATELKVVYVVNDQNVTWFGANNYQIPEELRREVVIYFRPNANTDWSALDGHLYIMADTADAIDNLDASGTPVKIIRNGQIFILRGEQLYNAQGQLVK